MDHAPDGTAPRLHRDIDQVRFLDGLPYNMDNECKVEWFNKRLLISPQEVRNLRYPPYLGIVQFGRARAPEA